MKVNTYSHFMKYFNVDPVHNLYITTTPTRNKGLLVICVIEKIGELYLFKIKLLRGFKFYKAVLLEQVSSQDKLLISMNQSS